MREATLQAQLQAYQRDQAMETTTLRSLP